MLCPCSPVSSFYKSFVHTYVGLQKPLLSTSISSHATTREATILIITMPSYSTDYLFPPMPHLPLLLPSKDIILYYSDIWLTQHRNPILRSSFLRPFLYKLTESVKEPAGNRWHAQIRIIWRDFIYKVTNYLSLSEEWKTTKDSLRIWK